MSPDAGNHEARPTKFTMFGSAGSGLAAVEAALDTCCAPYRIASAASWDPASALVEFARGDPLRQVPTLLLPEYLETER